MVGGNGPGTENNWAAQRVHWRGHNHHDWTSLFEEAAAKMDTLHFGA